jgi:hypothetical protein
MTAVGVDAQTQVQLRLAVPNNRRALVGLNLSYTSMRLAFSMFLAR